MLSLANSDSKGCSWSHGPIIEMLMYYQYVHSWLSTIKCTSEIWYCIYTVKNRIKYFVLCIQNKAADDCRFYHPIPATVIAWHIYTCSDESCLFSLKNVPFVSAFLLLTTSLKFFANLVIRKKPQRSRCISDILCCIFLKKALFQSEQRNSSEEVFP